MLLLRGLLAVLLVFAALPELHVTARDAQALAPAPSGSLNLRPLIGILSQPGGPAPKNQSYIAASYVKFVEASGARAVPIPYDLPKSDVKKLFSQINGVLIPGGGAVLKPGNGFFDTSEYLLNLTIAANDKGDYFPLHGTCLGFEALVVAATRPLNTSILTGFSAENNPSVTTLTGEAHSSRFYQDWPSPLIRVLQTEPVAMQNHHWGISYSSYIANPGLQEFFSVTSLSQDRHGKTFISSLEAKKYPITAVQWHPEKNAFEWTADLDIPHTPDAIEITHAVSNFIVNEARKNFHTRDSVETETKLLISNYDLVFTGSKRSRGLESDFDECYLIDDFATS